jgi:hypothetical protein
MRGRKTPAVAYITHLIKTTSRAKLLDILTDSPLKMGDIYLVLDYADGMSYKELAVRYNKSIQRINQWKRKTYEQLAFYLREK